MSSHSSKYKEVARERGRGDDSLHYSAFARCKSARKDGRTPFRVSVGSRVNETAIRFNESLYHTMLQFSSEGGHPDLGPFSRAAMN